MNAEQRILAWLERADFTGTGCRWSQERIGEACGCSRRTVIRVTQKLAEEDRIDSWLERRPGCKWPCRVYRVRHWNPHKRSGVLNVLRSIQERREAQCHTERTARPSRAQTPGVNPFLTASGTASAVVARRENELRRSPCMDPNRRLRAVSNPSLEAEPLVAELERKDQIIKTLQLELNRAMEDLAGMTEAARAAGRATVAAKGQRTRVAKAEARLEQIEAVVAHWRTHRPRTTEEFGTGGTKSFDVIEKALILKEKDQAGPVAACCEAIDGLHMAPWETYGKRSIERTGPKSVLRNTIVHALGDEIHIEKCRSIARWVACNEARAFDMWRAACEVEQAWLRKYWQEHDRRDDTPRFIVDGIETRADGR